MALTSDIKITRYGSWDGHEYDAQPMGASVTVYRGSLATTNASGDIINANNSDNTSTCWGLIDHVGPNPGVIDGGPGITNSGSAGAIQVEIATGTFFLASSTGSDQLSQATVGKVVYVYNENTVAATGSGSRCVAGVHVAVDTTQPGGYAIRLGSNQSTGGH
jgi:predicted RecA/RadA family phage recombinase